MPFCMRNNCSNIPQLHLDRSPMGLMLFRTHAMPHYQAIRIKRRNGVEKG
jgi:hypothetical protein